MASTVKEKIVNKEVEMLMQYASENTAADKAILNICITLEDGAAIAPILKAQLDMANQYMAVVCNEILKTADIIAELEKILRSHHQINDGAQLLGGYIQDMKPCTIASGP